MIYLFSLNVLKLFKSRDKSDHLQPLAKYKRTIKNSLEP